MTGVGVVRGETTILRDVAWSVAPDERWVVPLDDVLTALSDVFGSPLAIDRNGRRSPPGRGRDPTRGQPPQAPMSASSRGFDCRIASASSRSTTGPIRLPP